MKRRTIDAHRSGSLLNDKIAIEALGEPGNGGASLRYEVRTPDETFEFRFQSKNPAEGIDGLSMEALLAICADRLVGFQGGTAACDENAKALNAIARVEGQSATPGMQAAPPALS